MPDARHAPTGSASRNAHLSETVTVYYRWHPHFGQSLRVYERKRERTGERMVCKLADNSTLAIPVWMLSSDCMQLMLGPRQISVEALLELRCLLSSLQTTSDCDKASLTPTCEEQVDEANRPFHPSAVQSVAGQRTRDNCSPRQTKRTETRTGRATNKGRLSQPRDARQRR